jgi:Protein of unknown function (DUF3383)
MSSIPASTLVNVQPSVLNAGGNAINLNGMFLTTTPNRVPIGSVASFPSAAAVSSYFGASAKETAMANIYFGGYINSTAAPGAMLWTTYPQTSFSAFLLGGNVSGLSLTQLQALSGSLNLTVDGYGRNVASISLAAATSFSNAASIIQTALNGSLGPTIASFTGSIGLGGVTAYGTMTVTGMTSGTIGAGQTVSNGTALPTGVIILAQLTGSLGGTGTYSILTTGSIGSTALTTAATPITVSYDSVSGGFLFVSGVSGILSTMAFATGVLATSLLLATVTGANISQGANPASPGAFMTALTVIYQNWALFTTAFNPDSAVGTNTNKLLFAQWTSQQNNRYGYVPFDTDPTPQTNFQAPTSLGAQVAAAGYSGVCCCWENTTTYIAAFVLGVAASINFGQTNGRITFAYKGQSGFPASVTDPTSAANLLNNGYNFYGAYATANQNFQFFQNGQVSGLWLWLDTFVNQIWLNANFQLALVQLLAAMPSIPYNPSGYATIGTSLQTQINAALNFGAIRPGVVLSSTEILAINNQAGNANAAATVQTRGWYLQVKDPGPSARAARQTPICTFFYADGGAVQYITLASVDVE